MEDSGDHQYIFGLQRLKAGLPLYQITRRGDTMTAMESPITQVCTYLKLARSCSSVVIEIFPNVSSVIRLIVAP